MAYTKLEEKLKKHATQMAGCFQDVMIASWLFSDSGKITDDSGDNAKTDGGKSKDVPWPRSLLPTAWTVPFNAIPAPLDHVDGSLAKTPECWS